MSPQVLCLALTAAMIYKSHLIVILLLLYFRFCKMQFCKISVILCFSVGLLFCFSSQIFQLPLDRLAPNLARICLPDLDIKRRGWFLKSSKTWSQRPKKHRKIGQFFTTVVVFVRCDETVKDFWKIFFAMTPRVLYLSENVICDSSEPSSFLKHYAQCSIKKTRLWRLLSRKR